LLSIPSILEKGNNLVEETDDLSSNVLATSLLVVHDTGRGGEDDVSELTRGEEFDNPLLEVTELDVVAGGDDTSLVEAVPFISTLARKAGEGGGGEDKPSIELDNNLARAVVINLLELANVAY
jgi:nitrogen regulatory protein PII